jgi:magnesium-dependent phosphatase 1
VRLLGDVSSILHGLATEARWQDSIVAIASTCDEPAWARECLQLFRVRPRPGEGDGVRMADVFRPDCCEIYNANGKDNHIRAIAEKTGVDPKEMIFFDNQTNNTSCVAKMKGPTVVYTPEGVTRALFEEGLAAFPAPGRVVGPKARW